MSNDIKRPPRWSKSKEELEGINEKLNEVTKFRSGSGYGLDAETINSKIDTMASTFKDGFGVTSMEEFSKNDLRGVLSSALDMQRQLKRMSKDMDELVKKFAPIRVYLDNVSTNYQSDGPEPLDLEDEVRGGKDSK